MSLIDPDDQGQSSGFLPVFVFPSSIGFVANESGSHKQLITLYNPYEFPLCYKVLSTSPRKYSVIEPEGTLKPRCCVDIVIRHLTASFLTSVGVTTDKFRVQVQKYTEREVTGRKDVCSSLFPTRFDVPTRDTVSFQGLHISRDLSNSASRQYPFPASENHPIRSGNSNTSGTWLILASIVCIIALALPIQKLVAAYVLGMLTMMLIRN